jgi:hypothetical protein
MGQQGRTFLTHASLATIVDLSYLDICLREVAGQSPQSRCKKAINCSCFCQRPVLSVSFIILEPNTRTIRESLCSPWIDDSFSSATMQLSSISLAIALSSSMCAAAQLSELVALRELFTATFAIEAMTVIGQGPFGFRTIAPIGGGIVTGPALNGMRDLFFPASYIERHD